MYNISLKIVLSPIYNVIQFDTINTFRDCFKLAFMKYEFCNIKVPLS